MNGAGLGENLSALDLVALYAAKQSTDVITGHSLVEGLTEHFETGANDLSLLLGKTNDFNFLADLKGTTLNTTGSNSTTAGDGHNVLNRHKEGLISFTIGGGDELVNSLHELNDALSLGGVCGIVTVVFESLKSRTADDGGIIAGEVILVENLADFHLYEIEKLGIVNLIAFVHENNDRRNTNLTGEKKMLSGLSHRTVGSGDNKDSAVHLSSTGDHVFDVVGMAGAVNVSIVTFFGLILNVSGVDGNSALSLFGSLVDVFKVDLLSKTEFGKGLGDGGGKGGLTVVNVADSTNVYVGFGSVKFFFCHWDFLLLLNERIVQIVTALLFFIILPTIAKKCKSISTKS